MKPYDFNDLRFGVAVDGNNTILYIEAKGELVKIIDEFNRVAVVGDDLIKRLKADCEIASTELCISLDYIEVQKQIDDAIVAQKETWNMYDSQIKRTRK